MLLVPAAPAPGTTLIIPDQEYHIMGERVTNSSIAMLDKDHHIHMVPANRVVMMSIEHSAVKKIEEERFEVECLIRLAVEGVPHPLEDTIRFTFAAARMPSKDMMMELTFVQNHIIKYVFDLCLNGELGDVTPDDPASSEIGVSISSEIKNRMLASTPLKDVLERYDALPESMIFVR